MANRSLALIALAIGIIGLAATLSPGMVDSSNTIGYLRGTEHGRRSPTTSYESPWLLPAHRWGNEAAAMGSSESGGQIEAVLPDNAGSEFH